MTMNNEPLRLRIATDGVRVEEDGKKIVQDWPTPTSLI